MEIRRIKDYLGTGEHCHLSTARLPHRLPANPHSHDFHEVFWVREGSCRHLINGKEQQLQRGHAVFIQPSDTHRFQATSEATSIINLSLTNQYVAQLKTRYCDAVSGIAFWRKSPLPAIYTLPNEALETMQHTAHTLGLDPGNKLTLDYLLLLLINLQTFSTRGTETMTTPKWLQSALQHARQPEVFRLGAAGLVNAAGKGHEHVCRQTKLHTGKTPSEIINDYRCDYAAQQLAEDKLSITEISEYCGFESASHFYRLFKRHYQQTPRQYRISRQRSIV